MDFLEEFNKVRKILEEKNGINIEENNYDAILIKKLKESNTLEKNRTSKQTHIAITGESMKMFPSIYMKTSTSNNNMKNFFVLKAPIRIYQNNFKYFYLDGNDSIDFKDNDFLEVEVCIFTRNAGTDKEQIQLSRKRDDSKEFIIYRNSIKIGDYLIILKYTDKLLYDVFVIKNYDMSDKDNIFQIKDKTNNEITFITKECLFFEDTNISKPHQRIFFGAPGTGKSYKLNKEAEKNFDKNNISRVTFHPNYNYGNFIGTFKPFPKIKNDNETITYTYVPGILTKLLMRALNNPKEDFLLIIEEINRANTAAVFGDFFQLLDRDKNGNSEYDIVVSEDLKLLFSKNKISENINTECLEAIQHDEISVVEENQNSSENQTDFKLKLPSNFYIWATMNSADQGVMPLDTAFKRRWEFEYIGINDAYDKSKDENGKSEFDAYNFKANENELANWNDFRIKINEILSKCHVPEDKLLGPYFISKSILESGDPDKIKNAIKNKVLMYLYEDAGKQHRRKIFKDGIWETYSKLCEAFDKNCEKIFNDEIELLKSSPKEKAEKIIEKANENKDQNQENENVTTENNESNDE